jgi:hypothetical protein
VTARARPFSWRSLIVQAHIALIYRQHWISKLLRNF